MTECALKAYYKLLTTSSHPLTRMLVVFPLSPLESTNLRRKPLVFNRRVGVPPQI
jgi:hypothetical protein